MKPIIGLLGGIASGKSTVAAEFAKLGCEVIDADSIAHELLDEISVRDRIAAVFGDRVLDSENRIDRRKLGEIVFGDARKLESLNEILHPLVIERVEELLERYNRQSTAAAIVLDMPLLAEIGWSGRCDRLVFVDCKIQTRLKRARKKGIFGENQLKARENFQISLDNKVRLADNIVDNNSDFSAIVRQVAEIFTCVVNG